MLVWYGEQPWGITPLAGSQERTQDLPCGKPVTWPLGHGSCIEEVPYCFSKSSINFKGHTGKKSPILTQILVFMDCNSVWIQRWLWNDAQSLMWYRKGAPLFFKVIHQISRSHSPKNWWFESNFRNITRPVVAIKSLRFACDLEISHMTLKNNRVHFLGCFKLCASFVSHMWIQTGVTVRTCPNWDKICFDLCDLDFWLWPFAWTLPLSVSITPDERWVWRKDGQDHSELLGCS